MDGLKTINDTYGHHEGDYAIITMSQILKQVFLNHDIIGRIGGDEFVILSINQSTDYIEYVTEKVNLLCRELNRSSNKPYTLNISIGSIFYCSDHHDSLENLLTKADQILYIQKKLKKKRKLRDVQ